MAGLSQSGTPIVFDTRSPTNKAQKAHSRYLLSVYSAEIILTTMAIKNRTINAGIYFFNFSPCNLTPIVKRVPITINVIKTFFQKIQETNCSPNGITFEAASCDIVSPKVQVANLMAEKSNVFDKTAKIEIAIIINPIQHASQSSFFNKSEKEVFFRLFSINLYGVNSNFANKTHKYMQNK